MALNFKFLENMIFKTLPDFQKIKPYKGDDDNDGYIKRLGIYFQVYHLTRLQSRKQKLPEN